MGTTINDILHKIRLKATTQLEKEYIAEFQKLIDEVNSFVCKNDITEDCFKTYKDKVSNIIASFKNNFENDSSAFLIYCLYSIDTIIIGNNNEAPKLERKEQVKGYVNSLKCLQ